MNKFRVVITSLLTIPLGLVIYSLAYPDWMWTNPGLEYLYLLIGFPIVTLAYLAWFHPQFLETYFSFKKDEAASVSFVGISTQRFVVIMAGVFISGLILGAGLLYAVVKVAATPTPTPLADSEAAPTSFPSPIRKAPTADANVTATSGMDDTTPGLTPTVVAGTQASGRCTAIPQEIFRTINETVSSDNPANEIRGGWIVKSNAAETLWFVSAKAYGPDLDSTVPGVWSVFTQPDGAIEVYSVNTVAVDYSNADLGQDSDPITTMTNDGAQEAFDCAAADE